MTTTRLPVAWADVTISRATLRTQDLATTMLDFLAEHRPEVLADMEIPGPMSYWNELAWNRFVDNEPDEAQYLLEDLFDAMDSIAPEGTLFASHPGDGSDFGFWTIDEDD